MNARSSLMNQESKGSLGATIMINYVSILEDRVSICIVLPPRHTTQLRLVILFSTIIQHVVVAGSVFGCCGSWRLVLEAVIQLIQAADWIQQVL